MEDAASPGKGAPSRLRDVGLPRDDSATETAGIGNSYRSPTRRQPTHRHGTATSCRLSSTLPRSGPKSVYVTLPGGPATASGGSSPHPPFGAPSPRWGEGDGDRPRPNGQRGEGRGEGGRRGSVCRRRSIMSSVLRSVRGKGRRSMAGVDPTRPEKTLAVQSQGGNTHHDREDRGRPCPPCGGAIVPARSSQLIFLCTAQKNGDDGGGLRPRIGPSNEPTRHDHVRLR